jgi:hypothetical protein
VRSAKALGTAGSGSSAANHHASGWTLAQRLALSPKSLESLHPLPVALVSTRYAVTDQGQIQKGDPPLTLNALTSLHHITIHLQPPASPPLCLREDHSRQRCCLCVNPWPSEEFFDSHCDCLANIIAPQLHTQTTTNSRYLADRQDEFLGHAACSPTLPRAQPTLAQQIK